MRARGADLSSVQGSCDWKTFAGTGYDYAILKATQGHLVDPTFDKRIDGARAAGLLVGAYHFLTTTTEVSEQIQNCLSVVAPHAPDLGIFIDLEYPPPEQWAPPFTGDVLMKRALQFLGAVSAAGYKTTVYTYPFFAEKLPYGEDLLELVDYGLWIASYHDEKHEPGDADQPSVPAPWPTWRFWQWSGDHGGPAPGIPQVVDHDVFNGDRGALEAWAKAA